jgi:hypothetical protein
MRKHSTSVLVVVPWNDHEEIQELKPSLADSFITGCHLEDDIYENNVSVNRYFQTIAGQQHAQINSRDNDIRQTLLIRPPSHSESGLNSLYAYCCSDGEQPPLQPNIRATRLAMALGKWSTRFHGNIVLEFRITSPSTELFPPLEIVRLLCDSIMSPDLRLSERLPDWITSAARENYLDVAVIERLASGMTTPHFDQCDNEEVNNSTDAAGGETSNDSYDQNRKELLDNNESPPNETLAVDLKPNHPQQSTVFGATTLCYHCRRPASTLCPQCRGVYFCELPRTCHGGSFRDDSFVGDGAWSHLRVCQNFQAYTSRRDELSAFSGFDWTESSTNRDCQLSELPYLEYLAKRYLISLDSGVTSANGEVPVSSWWHTEASGWCGGDGSSAQFVDIHRRASYRQGFAPLDDSLLPIMGPIPQEPSATISLREMRLVCCVFPPGMNTIDCARFHSRVQ